MTVHYHLLAQKPNGSFSAAVSPLAPSIMTALPLTQGHMTPLHAATPQSAAAMSAAASGQTRDLAGSFAGFSGFSIYRFGIKRLLDVVLVLVAAPVIALVVLVLAAVVALDGGNPFYSQSRVGRGGHLYRMWKLRSMVVDADQKLEAYLATDPAARTEWDSTQKLKSDPRITRFGRLLRKSSLDELPQLWNVFIGDMSLVGPRPMMPCQQKLYGQQEICRQQIMDDGQAYFRMRPGITGPWQVSRRNESTFADRVRFDQGYEKSMSFKTDMGLILATLRVVMRATGY
jgi:lipopolysaccharide/colanic/teichoic acid biosynthesis glycosyltransferase